MLQQQPLYRLWLPASLAVHILLLAIITLVPLSAPRVPGSQQFFVVQVLNAAEPVPPPPPPPQEVPPPAVTPPQEEPRVRPAPQPVPGVQKPGKNTGNAPRDGNTRKPTPGHGNTLTPGPGKQPTAPPAVMTNPKNGTPVPPGTDGGTGTSGTSPTPSGPSYGAAARQGRLQGTSKAVGEIGINGTVVLLVEVSDTGGVLGVRIVSSDHAALNDPATQIVRRRGFIPAMRNGVAAQGQVRMRVTFTDGDFNSEEIK